MRWRSGEWLGVWVVVGGIAALGGSGCIAGRVDAAAGRGERREVGPAQTEADLTLADLEATIRPPPALPRPPSTRRAETLKPPLEAVHLYGRAYLELLAGRRLTATGLLEEAARLDPESAAVQQLLAQALLESAGGGGGAVNRGLLDRAMAALLRSAELQPDHLETWYRMGRVHLARDEASEAVEALRRATLTTEYASEPSRAVLVDLHLARAWDRLGQLPAAVGRYRRVLSTLQEIQEGRLRVPRDLVELQLLLRREDLLFGEIGTVFERAGHWSEAAELYAVSAARDAAAIEPHGRWARALVQAGRREEAIAVAGRLVAATHGASAALELLRRIAGSESAALAELERQAGLQPENLRLQQAAVAAYRAAGWSERAWDLARAAVAPSVLEGAADRMLLRDVMELSVELGRAREGAALLVNAMARCRRSDPGVVGHLVRVLTEPTSRNRLTLRALSRLVVSGEGDGVDESAARDYLLAVAAAELGRVEWSRRVLRETGGRFAAALVMWAEDVSSRRDLSDAALARERERLRAAAEALGDPALAEAVEGMLALGPGGSAAEAARRLGAAREAGAGHPLVGVAWAEALRRTGDVQRMEAAISRLAAEFPDHAAVQSLSVRHLVSTGRLSQAEQRLAVWRSLAPEDGLAQGLSVSFMLDVRRDVPGAVRLAGELISPGAGRFALQAAERAFAAANRMQEYAAQLGEAFAAAPRSVELTRRWVTLLTAQRRATEAEATLRTAADAMAGDPDLLYLLSGIAYGLGFQQLADTLLEQVLSADPEHAGAANDLGYHLAERETPTPADLDRALELATRATAWEPEVAAYLDTLGWVLYRRGDYSLAVVQLEAAAALMAEVDSVIADHLGDALWRLGRREEARRWWAVAVERLRSEGPEADATLLERVEGKLQAGDVPRVAPSLRDR